MQSTILSVAPNARNHGDRVDITPINYYIYRNRKVWILMIKVDIRSKHSAYITIGKWVIYVDNSTGEYIIDSWEEEEWN